jgi:sulfotransferase family protein
MPRSGTTLVEQIIASHPDVYGAGERSDIVRYVGENIHRESPTRIDAQHVRKLATDYIHTISRDEGNALRITGKMSGNLLDLGLIARMFPNARIFHCRRNPLDTCLSCYFQNFADVLPFSNDLAALGAYYLAYERLMDHWRLVLPIKIHEIVYEELVHDVEVNSRALIAHLDLDWDPVCLDFFKTERPVSTASMWQARQPVYTGSVGAWRNYNQHLGALKVSLRINTS